MTAVDYADPQTKAKCVDFCFTMGIEPPPTTWVLYRMQAYCRAAWAARSDGGLGVPVPSDEVTPALDEVAEAAALFARRLRGEALTVEDEQTFQASLMDLAPDALERATTAAAEEVHGPAATPDRAPAHNDAPATAIERWKDVAGEAEMEAYRPTLLPDQHTWAHIVRMANDLGNAVALPEALRGKPADIALVLLAGRDVGVPATTALHKIHVIDGRPSMAAELMRALILERGHDIWIEESTATSVTVAAQRSTWPEGRVSKVTWSLDDAKRANLIKGYNAESGAVEPHDRKQVWKRYTRAMLTARATSEIGRNDFPDVLLGVSYTPEELGADVDEGGEPVKIEARVSFARPGAPPSADERATAKGWESAGAEVEAHKALAGRIRVQSDEHREVANKTRAESGWPFPSRQSFDAFAALVAQWEQAASREAEAAGAAPRGERVARARAALVEAEATAGVGRAVPTATGEPTVIVDLVQSEADEALLCGPCDAAPSGGAQAHPCQGGGCECPCRGLAATLAGAPCAECGGPDGDHTAECAMRSF